MRCAMNEKWAVVLMSLGYVLAPEGARAQTILTLRQAVSLATQNDTRIGEAETRERSAVREAELSRARLGPNLVTGGGAVYTYGFPQTPGGAPPSIFNLGFTQTLFDLPARGRQRMAEETTGARKVVTAGVRDRVALETASAYLELVSVRHSLDRLRSAGDSAGAIVSLTIERLQEGRAIPIDVLRVRLAAVQLKKRIVSLESRESTLDGQLHLLTGLQSSQKLQLAAEDLPASPERSIPELVAMATASNMDLKAAEFEERQRLENVASQRGAYWPTIDFIGNYALFGRFNNFDPFFGQFQRNSVNVGVQAKVPIFTSQTGAAVALAQSQLLEARAATQRQRDQLEMEVRQLAQQLREADAEREVAELDLAVAQEAVRLVDARAAEGRADRLDRERAVVEEARAWDGFFQAGWAHQKAQLELRRTTGELSRSFP
jgi:outer membrane protein TolC